MPNSKNTKNSGDDEARGDGMVLQHSESLFQFAGDKENVPENNPLDGYSLFFLSFLNFIIILFFYAPS